MTEEQANFADFGLCRPLMKAIDDVGYEAPTPIQVKTIPLLLGGRDMIGQAQTGTGKTAAFALPILEKLDRTARSVQALVLTPTRELGIQVAESFYTYSKHMGGVHVLPVYGGQAIQSQIMHLKTGVQIVVGTPGRIMDHLRRATLDLTTVKVVVLDEADEMLRMGFIEDVEWILSHAPAERQTALFSATMPAEVRRVADRYLTDPVTVEIEHKTLTVPNTEQHYLIVPEGQKLDVLTHVLETEPEPGQAALIFSRTKTSTAELAEKLQARGYTAEAMHGDMSQVAREKVVRRLRSGQLETVVATDVAARGWDVEQIGLVINYDIPYDVESYVHRIGRTGRAGRSGKALLFVTPRQKRLLHDIERYIGQRITPVKMPTRADVAARRIALFKERILNMIEEEDLELYLNLVEELSSESGRDMAEIAAAAACLARGDRPLEAVIEEAPDEPPADEAGMVRLFINAGRKSGVRPADIVGALANETDLPGTVIGAIEIFDLFSFVEVPAKHLQQVLDRMDGVSIRGRDARIRVATPRDQEAVPIRPRFKPKGKKMIPAGGKKFRRKRRE